MSTVQLTMVRTLHACAGTLLIAATAAAQDAPAVTCESLSAQRLLATTISSVEAVTSGSFTPPRSTNALANLPPFCRLAGVIAPTADSQIRFEVWLPLKSWNGKFAGVGNGGWAGTISYAQLAEQLRRGYATASTNTGHDAAPPATNMARFAAEKPEQLIDFAYRSHHELAMKAKAIVEAFYGRAAAHSYFIGCSSGGYEGLMEAQRFPADYDGIVAGAPANNWTRLMAGTLDFTLAVLQDKASLLTPDALSLLYRGALAACDANDGVADGVLEDPRRCDFDPGTLACADGATGTCLTPAQVAAARRVYRGPVDPSTGAPLYPGLARGSEAFWPNRDLENPFPIPVSHYKWLVFGDPSWDWRTFEFTDPADYGAHREAEARLAPILNATNPDLREFRKRGGKLLQYHGWNDQLISPQNSIDYYESVAAFFRKSSSGSQSSESVDSFHRLFMVPGMAHCGGGSGPMTFDMQTALEQWVERSVAPDQIIATRSIGGVVDRSRPLCVYPKTAVYLGKGDINDASSFACRDPAAGRR